MNFAFDQNIVDEIKSNSLKFNSLSQEVSKVIIGQQDTILFIKLAILCGGHILIEGVPGVAKTTIIKAVNKAIGLKFARIQFTPDLLPSDLIGTLIYNPKTHEFETKHGPIFANLILADEINRAPAKVQAALLESMQEQQVTIGSNTFELDKPFLVFATQNPIDQEGTYKLPEAQIDRFMFKLIVGYPNKKDEFDILTKRLDFDSIDQAISKDDIFKAQDLVSKIYVDDKINEYIVNIISATRFPESYGLSDCNNYILYGVSPRATLALNHASKALAFLKQRHFVIPDDIKAVACAVLRHRILLSYEAQVDDITADKIIQKILSRIPAP